MDSKIKKKQDELDRTEKRLKSLENVRPQFMDEVTKILFCFILFCVGDMLVSCCALNFFYLILSICTMLM